jgi:UDP-N-acetylglucosamine 2-epimerase (non-hydrolysing)
MPWPEEANRTLTSRIATLHFAPTERNRQNLIREGVDESRIFVTGNTAIDALLLAVERTRKERFLVPGLPLNWRDRWANAPVVLITGHRRENFGSGLENICRAITVLAKRFPNAQFVYPVHLNPNVRDVVYPFLGPTMSRDGNIHLIEPLSYLHFVALLDIATIVLTDSGGIQEEAPSLGKPVLVMRETTERPEAIEAGIAKLVGLVSERIIEAASELLLDKSVRDVMRTAQNPFGDGKATKRILDICDGFLRLKAERSILSDIANDKSAEWQENVVTG